MAAKAEKLRKKRAKRGRPLKENVNRTDTGQISRAATHEDSPFKVAKETRMRLFGLSSDDAGQPEANSVIGRLKLSGEISHEQYEALDRFICSHQSYMKVINAPDSLAVPGAMARSARDEESEIEWRLSVERRYKDARRAIRDAQNYCNGNLYAAIDYLGFRNEYHPHMVGDLRLVGNVLTRHYGLCRAA